MDIQIMLGSEIKFIPEDIPFPESADFKDKMSVLLRSFGWDRKEIKRVGKTERYLLWVKYEACRGDIDKKDSDFSLLFQAISRVSRVPEEDVVEAVETFRDPNLQRSRQ